MNTESIKGVGRSESTREFKTISESVSDVKESVSESGFERVDGIESKSFRTREFNTILRSCGVSRTAQSFFESMPEDVDLS